MSTNAALGLTGAEVAPGIVHAAERAVWLYVRQHGLRGGRWGYSELPPGVTRLPELAALTDAVCGIADEDPEAAVGPQLLIRLPELDTPHTREQYETHVDRTPTGGTYRRVVGVSLTHAPGGTVRVRGGIPLGHHAGHVYAWTGDAPHEGIPNAGSAPRITAYWRFP